MTFILHNPQSVVWYNPIVLYKKTFLCFIKNKNSFAIIYTKSVFSIRKIEFENIFLWMLLGVSYFELLRGAI